MTNSFLFILTCQCSIAIANTKIGPHPVVDFPLVYSADNKNSCIILEHNFQESHRHFDFQDSSSKYENLNAFSIIWALDETFFIATELRLTVLLEASWFLSTTMLEHTIIYIVRS